ncbi:MAG: hypothetical protein KBT29_04590 [Prevotellaceae bacterium]|nr:hypothetical protein [Candidatus Minthosoma caballi]
MAKKTSKTFSYEEEVVGNEVRITIVARVNSAVHKAVDKAFRTSLEGEVEAYSLEHYGDFVSVVMRCEEFIATGKSEKDIKRFARRYWKEHNADAIAAMASKKDRKQFIALRVHEMVEEEILVGTLSDIAKALRFKYHGKLNYETTRRYMHPKK